MRKMFHLVAKARQMAPREPTALWPDWPELSQVGPGAEGGCVGPAPCTVCGVWKGRRSEKIWDDLVNLNTLTPCAAATLSPEEPWPVNQDTLAPTPAQLWNSWGPVVYRSSAVSKRLGPAAATADTELLGERSTYAFHSTSVKKKVTERCTTSNSS